jgi:hypothetical protein
MNSPAVLEHLSVRRGEEIKKRNFRGLQTLFREFISALEVHSPETDAFRDRVISHAIPGKCIGKEGAAAVGRDLFKSVNYKYFTFIPLFFVRCKSAIPTLNHEEDWAFTSTCCSSFLYDIA